MKALNRIIEQARSAPRCIVLSEGDDPRVLVAAALATSEGIARITLVGNRTRIESLAASMGIGLEGIQILDPATSPLVPELAELLFRLRRDKGISREQAAHAAIQPLLCANLLVKAGYADGTVSGAVHTTANVVRSAIQIIGVRPGCNMVSSFFLMMLCEPFHSLKGGLIFSDCALTVDPDAFELSEIAMAAADSARDVLMVEPRVAMLSFSTGGSARHAAVDKVIEAARRVKSLRPGLVIDEDVQFDAAIVTEISNRKLPESLVRGAANVLIFPNLEAGNIGYKIAERLGGAVAVGPLLQGLARPANDLSRGCRSEDVFHVIAVSVVQAQKTVL